MGGCRVREKTYKRAFEWALDAAHLSDDGDHSYPAPIPACVRVRGCEGTCTSSSKVVMMPQNRDSVPAMHPREDA